MVVNVRLFFKLFLFLVFGNALFGQENSEYFMDAPSAESVTLRYMKNKKWKEAGLTLGQNLSVRLKDDREVSGILTRISTEGIFIGKESIHFTEVAVFRYVEPISNSAYAMGGIGLTLIAVAAIIPKSTYRAIVGDVDENYAHSMILVAGVTVAVAALIAGTSRNLRTNKKEIQYSFYDKDGNQLD